MNEIAQAKVQVRLQNWQLMYSEYASSGLTVKEWCENNHLCVKTFYYRLKRLRTEALQQEQHDIVAVKQNTDMNNTELIRISGRGITAELISGAAGDALEGAVIMLKEARFEQVYIVCGYTDMRRSIDGLTAIIQQNFGLEPCSGSLFLFCGKRRDRMKALLWEGDGFLLLYKRLDNGCFQWPRNGAEAKLLTHEQYIRMLQGLSVEQPKAIKTAPKRDVI